MKTFTIIGFLSLAIIDAINKAAALAEWNRRTNGEQIERIIISN